MRASFKTKVLCGQHTVNLSVILEMVTLMMVHPNAEWR
jgi:hypothetical protein